MGKTRAWKGGIGTACKGFGKFTRVVRAGLTEWGTREQPLEESEGGGIQVSEGTAIPAEGTSSAKDLKSSVLHLF